jgi:hypothetical protein
MVMQKKSNTVYENEKVVLWNLRQNNGKRKNQKEERKRIKKKRTHKQKYAKFMEILPNGYF